MHIPAPKLVHVLQRLARILHVKLHALIAVHQIQFAIPVIIAINHFDVWKSKVGHVRSQLVAYSLPLLFGYCPLFIVYKLVNKQIELITKLFGQIIAQKRDIVIELSDLKDLFAALTTLSIKQLALFLGRIVPPLFYVLENLIAEIIGIQLSFVR